MPDTTRNAGPPRFFLSDVTRFPVTFEPQAEGKQLVRGLPVVRTGKYKGHDFDADALRQMADNFATIRDRDGFTPLLTPRHYAEADEALGPFADLRFDEGKGALVADAVVGDDTAQKIESKQYRYVSGEVDWEYELQAEDQRSIGPAIAGAAFVNYPASRGMQIDVVLNAEEFPQLFPEAAIAFDLEELTTAIVKELTPLLEGGRTRMATLKERVVALFAKAQEGEDVKPEDLDALVEEIPEEGAGDNSGDDADDSTATLDTDNISRQMAQLKKAGEEKDERITALEQTNRRDWCDRTVDDLVRGGHLPPAQRQETYLMLERLSATGGENIIVLSKVTNEKGEVEDHTIERTPVEHYVESIKGMGLRELTPTSPRGQTFSGEYDEGTDNEKAEEDAGKELVALQDAMADKASPPDEDK